MNHTHETWIVYQPPYSKQIQIRDEAGEMVIAAVPEKADRPQALKTARLIAKAPEMADTLAKVLVYCPVPVQDEILALLVEIDGNG